MGRVQLRVLCERLLAVYSMPRLRLPVHLGNGSHRAPSASIARVLFLVIAYLCSVPCSGAVLQSPVCLDLEEAARPMEGALRAVAVDMIPLAVQTGDSGVAHMFATPFESVAAKASNS